MQMRALLSTKTTQDKAYFSPPVHTEKTTQSLLKCKTRAKNSPNETRQLVKPYRLNDLT